MKSAAAFAVLALAQCLAAPSESNDQYKDLIIDVLTFAREELTLHDPFRLPDITEKKFKTQDLDLTVNQTNTLISKASSFIVKKVDTDPATLSATVRLHIPELLQTFDFDVAGTGFGRQVSGSGHGSVSIQEFDQTVVAVFQNPDTSLQLKSLTLDYSFTKLVLEEKGLLIAGMTEDQVVQFVSDKLVDFFTTKKAIVERATAAVVQSNVNSLIAGKTLAEVAAFIKSLIHQ